MKLKTFFSIIVFLILTNNLIAQPPQPSGFYGTMLINGEPVPADAVVSPYINDVKYASDFVVTTPGQYGLLNVNGDDPSTLEIKEGGAAGEQIVFKVLIAATEYVLTPIGVWTSGTNHNVNLVDEGSVPVELSSFRAVPEDNSVNLYWTTVSETNNFGFEIQRSSNNVEFSQIGFLPGQGTISTPHSYQYADHDILAGKYYYRLKQIDTDGSFDFSPVLEVNFSVPTTCSLLQNFPNPFNPVTTIQFKIPINNQVKINIYDIKGKLVRNLVDEIKPAGSHSIEWDSRNNEGITVSNGVYFYRMISGEYSSSKKMILMK